MASDITELKLSEVKAVLFDFGDTLVVLSPSREEVFVRAAHTVGLDLRVEAVRDAYRIVDFHNKFSSVQVTDRARFYRDYNEQLCEALGISSHFPNLQPALAAQFRQDKQWTLMKDAPDALHRLQRRGIPLALVANWDSNLASLTEQLGVRQFFSVIVPSQAAGVEKPDPAIFRLAVERLSLPTETDKILYVGNEYRADVLGARAAGLTPVLIDRSGSYPHADCLRFASLLDWVESME